MRHVLLVLASTLALTAPAVAQTYGPNNPYAPAPGSYQRDGLFVRLTIGPSFTYMGTEVDGFDISISGTGAQIGVALGGSIAPNLRVFGELLGNSAVNPEIEVDGVDAGEADISASVVGIGGGLIYYMPNDVYLSGTLAFSQISVSDDNGDQIGESDMGMGVSALIGKEWWVHPQWSLGVAGQLYLAAMQDKEEDFNGDTPVWQTVALGVLFTATYN